jgi:hypothetical protein
MLTRPGALCILHNVQGANTKKFVHIAVLTFHQLYVIIEVPKEERKLKQ